MDFATWKLDLAAEIIKVFDMNASELASYLEGTGDDCWREMFDDGLTPKEAAAEEAWAAMWSQ